MFEKVKSRGILATRFENLFFRSEAKLELSLDRQFTLKTTQTLESRILNGKYYN